MYEVGTHVDGEKESHDCKGDGRSCAVSRAENDLKKLDLSLVASLDDLDGRVGRAPARRQWDVPAIDLTCAGEFERKLDLTVAGKLDGYEGIVGGTLVG